MSHSSRLTWRRKIGLALPVVLLASSAFSATAFADDADPGTPASDTVQTPAPDPTPQADPAPKPAPKPADKPDPKPAGEPAADPTPQADPTPDAKTPDATPAKQEPPADAVPAGEAAPKGAQSLKKSSRVASLAAAPTAVDTNKWVVCKYSATPQTGEKAQTIIINAVDKGFNGVFPHPFNDAQGASVAIRYANEGERSNQLSINECPVYGGPTVVTPPSPQPTDPCGPGNAFFPAAQVPATTNQWTVATVGSPVTQITVTAKAGFVFDAQGTTVKVYNAVDSGAPCVVTPPAKPKQTDPCGPNNAYFADADIPASTASYTVTTEGDPVTKVTITATAGNVFDAQGTTVVDYTVTDSGAPCVVTPPAKPEQTDPCGLDNAFFPAAVIPASNASYTVTTEGDPVTKITVTAKAGTVFDEQGTTEVVYTVTDSGEPCVVPAPGAPAPTDPCGPDNAYYAGNVIPSDTSAYTVSTKGDPVTEITITSTPGNVLNDQGDTTVTYTAVDSGEACVVGPPAQPEQTDPCGLDNAYFPASVIPESTDEFTVSTEGDPVTKITITATEGNVFDEQGTTEVVYTVEDSGEPCVVPAPTAPAPVDPCGPNNAFFADEAIPSDAEGYTVATEGDPVTKITITAKPGYVLNGQGDTEVSYTATDSGEPCVVPAPAAPAPTDPCGPDNAYFATDAIPGDTEGYTVTTEGDPVTKITITATEGNVLDEQGNTEVSYTAIDSGVPCAVDARAVVCSVKVGTVAARPAGTIPGTISIVDVATLIAHGFAGVFPFTYVENGVQYEVVRAATEGETAADVTGVSCDVESASHHNPPKDAAGLPNTGGPAGWLVPVGVGLVLAGAALMLIRRRGETA
ncbi:hypothetical protein GCM10022237_12910 [Nocardioides ginsengisoli]|uniref:LPXTG cell wall anchor domain-containing protein n=1 Tax=Nocardioides ginsengisoli TaxID=363868 RepID=A0ABW3VY32_9ACTN